ncbi:MAG TPA: hypothetical protein VKB53_07010, partial [Gammaproteobacteria bacterium]|nr:hypothetical protein [Gammaproteobacteria bacterium]
SAWQAELKATGDPSLKQQLSYREGELLPRFVEHYQQLKALRRRVRRGLQRQWKRSLSLYSDGNLLLCATMRAS